MDDLREPFGALIVGTYADPADRVLSAVNFALLGPGVYTYAVMPAPPGSAFVSFEVVCRPAAPIASTCAVQLRCANRAIPGSTAPLSVSRGLTGPAALASLADPAVETGALIVVDNDANFLQLQLTITGGAMLVKALGAAV